MRTGEPPCGNSRVTVPDTGAFACIHRYFEKQAALSPNASALMTESCSVTFHELDARANQLASWLNAQGIGPGSKVAIAIPRSVDAVVCVLACLKSGAAYVPIGAHYAKPLIDYILHDAGVDLALCQSPLTFEGPTKVAHVNTLGAAHLESQSRCGWDWPGNSLAWILYTSGSSGQPKAVRGTQRGIVQRCEALWTLQPFTAGEVAIQNTALTVVDSFWELWGPLCQGVPVLVLDEAINQDLPRLVRALQFHQVTRICLVPSLLRSLLTIIHDLERQLPHLRQWVVSGESLTHDLVCQFYKHLPHATLLNQYGLTETSADITSFDTRGMSSHPTDISPVPIGTPFPGIELFILDERLALVPEGEEGELYVSGACLVDGYLNRPELTAERFPLNPFSSVGARMLRTGDRARRLARGEFLVSGRADRQVKVRGYRVELDGLESLISRHSAVDSAAVTYQPNASGHSQLIAYICPVAAGKPTEADLSAFCAERAPSYMIPHRFIFVDDMPRTPSGKIDRKALPSLMACESSVADRPDLPPLQDAVRRIWCRLLAVSDVDPQAEFFRVGGDSLLMMRLLSEIRHEFHCEVSLEQFVREPTVGYLCELIRGAPKVMPGADFCEMQIRESLPDSATRAKLQQVSASLSQTSIWMHEQIADDGNPYGIVVSAMLYGPLRIPILESACRYVMQVNPVLSTRIFRTASAGLQQKIVLDGPLPFEVVDGRGVASEHKWRYVTEHIRSVSSRRLDVSRNAPFDVRVVATAEDETALIIQVHHLVCDGHSIKVLMRQISEIYNAEANGGPLPTRTPDYRFAAYCDWERRFFASGKSDNYGPEVSAPGADVISRALSYWERVLPDRELTQALPADYAADPRSESFKGGEFRVEVARSSIDRYLSQVRWRGVTAFHLFFASYSMALFRTFSYGTQAIGFTAALRPRELEDALGCYVSVLPCLLGVSEHTTCADLLCQVRDSMWSALEWGRVPFEVVLNHLRAKGRAREFRGFQTSVSFDDSATDYLQLHALKTQSQRVHGGSSKFPLSLNVEVAGSGFILSFEYRTKLYRESSIQLLARTALEEVERLGRS